MVELYHGDCLEIMKSIPDKSIDMVLCDYSGGMSMREIASKYQTNHKLISRILKRNSIKTREPLRLRGKRKFPCEIDLKYNNMITHLKWNVGIEWARGFKDFEKLKFLNKAITNRDNRYPFSTKEYMLYIDKFYNDEQFNRLYLKWTSNKKDKYLKPSIDHKTPKAKGGCNSLDNLQFLTWFENRCKNDMSEAEWSSLKNNIKDYLT